MSSLGGDDPYSLGIGVNSTADVLVTLLGSSSTRWYSKIVLRRDSETEAEPSLGASHAQRTLKFVPRAGGHMGKRLEWMGAGSGCSP